MRKRHEGKNFKEGERRSAGSGAMVRQKRKRGGEGKVETSPPKKKRFRFADPVQKRPDGRGVQPEVLSLFFPRRCVAGIRKDEFQSRCVTMKPPLPSPVWIRSTANVGNCLPSQLYGRLQEVFFKRLLLFFSSTPENYVGDSLRSATISDGSSLHPRTSADALRSFFFFGDELLLAASPWTNCCWLHQRILWKNRDPFTLGDIGLTLR